MNLTPWRNKTEGGKDEFSPLVAFRNEMDRLFDSFFREPLGAMDWPVLGQGRWSPAVDMAESGSELTVRAELPGMDPKDIDISVSGGQLVISGEKRESTEHKDKDVYHTETRYGSFRRMLPLPEGVDTEKVEANYSNGVLTLRLPKTPSAATKRIEVKAT